MSLTGQLNDLSLGELIEFFCNQRKTGRLKVDYALAPGVFFIDAGDLVDAKVGALDGAEAVYFAMTLPSASFDFSAGVRSSRRTINERWPSVVLEGLRRIDEGIPPADAFNGHGSSDVATLDHPDNVGELKAHPAAHESAASASIPPAADTASNPDPPHAWFDQTQSSVQDVQTEQTKQSVQDHSPQATRYESPDAAAPFSLTVEAATASGGGRRKAAFAAIAAVLVVCGVAAVPLSKRLTRNAQPAPAVESSQENTEVAPPTAPADTAATDEANVVTPTPDFAAEEAARREREAREREARERARRQREEAARRAAEDETALSPAVKPASASSGPKSVRVQITYDEAGRVTQAAAVGTSPGAEAYASTAVRVARGRRFPAGKAGTTIVTIPIN